MSLFQTHKRFIEMGAFLGAAPYRLKSHYFETSTSASLIILLISISNILTIYRMILSSVADLEYYADKPFGYGLLFNSVFFLNYTSGLFILGGIFFSRKKLIHHMNRLSDHVIMQKTYDFERKPIQKFSRMIYLVLCFTFVNLLAKNVIGARSHNYSYIDVVLSIPLLASCALILVQFAIAVQIIYLSYCRIQYELREGKLTVAKVRECCLLDTLLKDYGSVVETAYGAFNFVYIALSFLYVLTIELYIADGGPTCDEAVNSYITGLPPLSIFVWYIWKCTLINREAENTVQCLHDVAVDVGDPDVREAIELFLLQLMSRDFKLRAGGFFSLDFSLLYSMVGAVTSYVVTLFQFQAAFHKKS